ncbi:hypothetical protein KIN34_02965 [Cellulomonas sp. DKR-3]|uniref:Alpha-amylase n=1 Tax=Cellulomonas fulva TaxID=2835530 RepID=A0ABS5TVT6_9CELL|nr:hypothetical protein [Cellulomonas fulva]MBT0993250.1 hypothetical protein [Cellulomonas fulva]
MRTSLPTSRGSRVLAAAVAALAAGVASLAGAVPAAAADTTTITGTVVYPAGAEASDVATVLAWLPTARGIDVSAAADVAADGSFSLTDLSPRTGYQLSYTDAEGQFATGYYRTTGSLVAKAANASLVTAGGSPVTIAARTSAPMTEVALTLPGDGTFPDWSPMGFFVAEPGNGRVVSVAGVGGPATATALLRGSAAPTAAAGVSGFGAQGFGAASASPAAGEANVVRLPVTGLLRGGSYTFALPTSPDFTGYYYGGAGQPLKRSLAKAGAFTGGTPSVEVLVMAPWATVAPAVTGQARLGVKLTGTRGTWSTAGKPAYQWLRNGVAIKGAVYSSYTPKAADLGRKLKLRVTFTSNVAGYAPGTAYSTATALVVK